MGNMTRLITVSALLHDIGKLFERADMFHEARTDDICLSMCPTDKSEGRHTHLHAGYTRAFCEWMGTRFDCLRGADQDWKIWCSAHHRDDETGGENSVIRFADRFSSSEREEGVYYHRNIHRRTLLEPVLERVYLEGLNEKGGLKTSHRYPLVPLSNGRDDLFPTRGTELKLKEMNGAEGSVEPEKWDHLLSKEPMNDQYAALGKGLMMEIEALSEKCPDIGMEDLIVCLLTLLERYTSNVPSATNLRHPDISLFDHSRTTAAIAQALYLQFEHEGRFPTAYDQNDPTPRWLMVCGDFSGIQKFIYNLTNKGAAKGLRGRSFYVSHFCRICADYILRELGLTKAALLYNSGGKFYMLIPLYLKTRLYEVRANINEWLLKKFQGTVFFGLGLSPVTAIMFSQGKMSEAWKECAENLDRDRLGKFREQLHEDHFFEPIRREDPTRHCRICGSGHQIKERDKGGETFTICDACDEMERLGKVISDSEAILTVIQDAVKIQEIREALDLREDRVFSFEDLNAHFIMIPKTHLNQLERTRISGECIFLNKVAEKSFADLPLPVGAISFMHIAKWDKSKKSRGLGGEQYLPWDFEDYANNASGIERLGVLRMDVDNLGLVFMEGLQFPVRGNKGWGDAIAKGGSLERKTMASISRIATLSRQLNLFFSGYLNELLEKPQYDRCQTIYAGGDDLFIIGSWDQLPLLGEEIRKEFQQFSCENPSFSISGGLTLHRGRYPIYKAAQQAGDAEKKAKTLRNSWKLGNLIQKDAFCFLGVPVPWEYIGQVHAIKELLEAEMTSQKEDGGTGKNKSGNRGFLAHLFQVTANNKSLVQSLQREAKKTEIDAWKAIEFSSWRWRTAYQLRRRYGKDEGMIRQWLELLFTKKEPGKPVIPIHAWLELPVRWTEFLHREKGGK